MAVGANGETSLSGGVGANQLDNSGMGVGAVYVFTRAGTTWTQQTYLKAATPQSFDEFGDRLALSADGNTLAVGSGGYGSDPGAVYLFIRSGTSWAQQAKLRGTNTEGGDSFGADLALSADGTMLAVGAPGEDSAATGVDGDAANDAATGAGAAYVFTRSGSTWSQQAYVKASNTGANDSFGVRVALSGDGSTLAVSAPGEDSRATGVGGGQADDSASQAGAVYVFTHAGGAWSQQAYVKASNTETGDSFGQAVSLSGDGGVLAVGASLEDGSGAGIGPNQADNAATYAGAAYVFGRSGATWRQQAYVKAASVEADDRFGYQVRLSSDGRTLAATAYGKGDTVGGVYLY